MKIIFLGTPEFAVPVLKAINQSHHKVVAVITQPDKVNGRNSQVTPSPIKILASKLDLPLLQFTKISREGVEIIKSLQADIMVTAAYGQILSQTILDITKFGVINVHASLLPKYRGAAPVQWAIINGDTEVGVTIMQTELTVDSGDMILSRKINLDGTENTQEALTKLSNLGSEAILEALDLIEQNKATFTSQDSSKVTFCRMLTKDDGKINFAKKAQDIVNLIRGVSPNPGAFCNSSLGLLKIISSSVANIVPDSEVVGEVLVSNHKQGLVISCGEKTSISLLKVQLSGGKPLDIKSFLLGKTIAVGSIINE